MNRENHVTHLIADISKALPIGTNLREELQCEDYFQLKNLRRQAKVYDRKKEMHHEVKDSFSIWNEIRETCASMLTKKSKDIELICWLIEAETRCNNIFGLYSGFNIFDKLWDKFDGKLHPLNGQTKEASLQAFINMNGESKPGYLIDAMHKIDLIVADEKKTTLADINHLLITKDKSALDKICNQINLHTIEYFTTLKETAEKLQQTYLRLTTKLGQEVPTSYIKNTITTLIESITYLITHHNQYQTTLEDTQKQPNNSIASATNNNIQQPIERNMVNSSSTSKSILTRQDALQQIQAVKEYFVAHEPHSPIRLLLNRCLKWSRMSFSQLIQEIVSDEKEIESIFKITGIEKHKEKTCQV